MKNQYFGDVRDLFKYDLVLELLCKTDLERFAFIPMLTGDDDTGHGNRTDHARARAGTDNKDLIGHLEYCVSTGRRDVQETSGIFELPKYGRFDHFIYPYRFRDETRFQYFQGIPLAPLQDAVVVLDPDNGLWVRSARPAGEKYLRYDEAKHVFDAMGDRSVLLIFQYIPRVGRFHFFTDISRLLKEWVNGARLLQWISDNQVVFFVLTKDNERFKEVRKVLEDYREWYDLIYGSI